MNVILWLNRNWELICICLGVLVNALGLVYNICRSFRAGRTKSAEDWLAILEAAREYECEAERLVHYDAAEKLQYVLSRLRLFVAERGCSFDESAMIEQIEADIAFSKQVNSTDREHLE
ncbi:MAG: hypothetical protein IJY50_08810 [Clostridia bacterium]|nr:hypothetical protein [Clostridia bacterium]